MTTKKEEKAFIRGGGRVCPGCGMGGLVTGTYNPKLKAAGLIVRGRLFCPNCKRLWEAHFIFDGLEEVKHA